MAERATTDNGSGQTGSGSAGSSAGSGQQGSSSSASSAPTSAQAALEKAASAASGDSSSSQAGVAGREGQSSADATGSAAAAGQSGQQGSGQHSQQGAAIPLDRHEAILANARKEYEWLGQLGATPEQIREAAHWHRRLQQDPRAFLQQLANELAEQGAFEDDEEIVDPEPDLQSEDGKKRAYSDTTVKQLLQNQEKRLMRIFKPYMESVDGFKSEAEGRRLVNESIKVADSAYEYASKLKFFKENEKAIGERLAAMDKGYRRSIGTRAALLECYHAVVDPIADSLAEQRARERMREKANGGGAGNVGAGGTQDQKPQLRDGDVDGLAAHMARVEARLAQP